MENRKNILLTGGSGTVGIEVLKQLVLLKSKYNTTVFDIMSDKSVKNLTPFSKDSTVIYGNISNEDDLQKACYNQDVVIHLAAIIPPLADDNIELSNDVNILGTQNLIKLLELHSPKAFLLYSSSISVYGDRLKNPLITVKDLMSPSNRDEYATTKIIAERSIKNSKLDWSIFRLTAIMGGHKISKLMFHQPLKTSLEIASPKDTARAFVNAIEKQAQLSKKVFNLGGGEKCRIVYDEFLSRSFSIFGLGKLNFPPKTFAERNFHCGYYADGHELEDILHFRKDTLEDYFNEQKSKVSLVQRALTSLLRIPIKYYLQKQSEPLEAYVTNDLETMHHYFISNTLK